jgi:hypothetical protein
MLHAWGFSYESSLKEGTWDIQMEDNIKIVLRLILCTDMNWLERGAYDDFYIFLFF